MNDKLAQMNEWKAALSDSERCEYEYSDLQSKSYEELQDLADAHLGRRSRVKASSRSIYSYPYNRT